MVTELVFFDMPKGCTRARALELYRGTAGKWLANPDLVQKYYYFDEEKGVGGGVYIWRSREAAERWHGEDYRQAIRAHYGSEPKIQILDALIHLDPPAQKMEEL